jgi:hypothetical protein
MAAVNATVSRDTAPGAIIVTWSLANADTGTPYQLSSSSDLTCHTFGTFGGATITWQGSSDGTNWHAMTQKSGTSNMAYTTAANHSANEMPPFVRPISAGGTGTAITASLCIYPRWSKNQF